MGRRVSSTSRRLLVVLLLAGLLGLPALPAAAAAPPAPVRLTGQVVDADGRPVPGATVRVQRPPSLLSGLAIVFSLGLLCFGRSEVCFPSVVEARTDGQGRYAARWPARSPLQSPGQLEVRASASVGRDGATLTRTDLVRHRGTRTAVRQQRLWDPAASVTRLPARQALVHVDPLDESYGENPDTAAALVDARGRVVWNRILLDEQGNALVDERIVERGTRGLQGRAAARPGGGLQAAFTSSPHPAGPVTTPLSRGARCVLFDGRGRAVPLSPCAYTDGDLGSLRTLSARPGGCETRAGFPSPACPASVQIDLGAPATVDLITVRGCDRCALEVSSDGRTWRPFGPAAEDDGALDGDVAVRDREAGVRLVRYQGSRFRLREVSVHEAVLPEVPVGAPQLPVG